MDTQAIIQARMGSTRLPDKVLMKLADKTVLEHVIERVSRSELVQGIVVATTVKKRDLEIARLCAMKGISIFCGSEDDVLDRFYQAAKQFRIKNIIRITADCPLIDPQVIDRAVKLYFDTGADYVSNTLEETFPDGLDVEVFSFDALEAAWKDARLMSEREHVTPYIRKNSGRFSTASMKHTVDLSGKRWTLDTQEDLEFLKIIFENIYYKRPDFNMTDILAFIEKYPEIERINSEALRNEGYLKSLAQDTAMETGRA